MAQRSQNAMDPREAGWRVKTGIENEQLYILSDARDRGPVEERFARLMAAFDTAAALDAATAKS
jgi:hypothetical protein